MISYTRSCVEGDRNRAAAAISGFERPSQTVPAVSFPIKSLKAFCFEARRGMLCFNGGGVVDDVA